MNLPEISFNFQQNATELFLVYCKFWMWRHSLICFKWTSLKWIDKRLLKGFIMRCTVYMWHSKTSALGGKFYAAKFNLRSSLSWRFWKIHRLVSFCGFLSKINIIMSNIILLKSLKHLHDVVDPEPETFRCCCSALSWQMKKKFV